MPSLAEGFFHALQQDPDDDLTRLAYADSLEEYGGEPDLARAELIRVQVTLAALPALDRRAAPLAARQDELLAHWGHVWLGPCADVLHGWAFRRGFVEAVTADAAAFLEHAPDWFARWPTLAAAKLTRANGLTGDLADSPWLAHLRGLDLSDNEVDAAALADLTASPFVCLLRALDLSRNPIGAEGARLLAEAAVADDLSELHLSGCGLRGVGLERLLGRRSRQWRRLDLADNWLYRQDLLALADCSVMRHLVSLNLASNPLGENGIAAVAESPEAGRLVDLGICDTGTGDSGLTALSRSPHLRSLRSLDLRANRASAWYDDQGNECGGFAEFCRSPLLGQLRRLMAGPSATANTWTAAVLDALRPRRLPLEQSWWTVRWLRKSKYLMPSQLVECDLEELWWLGDTRRERVPDPWKDE